MRRLILRSFQSPGDIVMLTAAVRDLHTAHPQQFQTDVRTAADSIWDYNPFITKLSEGTPGVEVLDMHYPLVHESNHRPYHFIHGFAQFLEGQLGIKIPITRFSGDIHLSPTEKSVPLSDDLRVQLPERYWIMMAGGKYDFTAKWWNPASYQKLVDHFQGRISFVQCGESGHWHPPLTGVVNLVGMTTTRQFIRLVHHADGVICPVTFAMHLAAAVETPPGRPQQRACVVIAGGREPAHWEAYTHHQYISTNGMLACCQTGGCWKSRCQLVGDGDTKDRHDLCEQPVQIADDLGIPSCMEMISAEDVIRRVEMYYQGGLITRKLSIEERPNTTSVINHDISHNGSGKANSPAPEIANTEPVTTVAPVVCLAQPPQSRISVSFHHGLGDCVYFAHMIPLYIQRGHQIEVECTPDKALIFEAAGAMTTPHAIRSHPWGYPSNWTHTGQGHSWQGSKMGHNLTESPLPHIGTQADLWDEYVDSRVDVLSRLSEECIARVEQWFEALVRPIVLFHSRGNTSQDRKSIPNETAEAFYREFVERCDGTLVLLDWDNRVPRIASARVRHLSEFGKCQLDSLLAMIDQADLMIGVDSGPLHTARFTNTPTIGIWLPGHYPTTYTLPRREQLNVVLADHTHQWNRFKRIPWNILEHPGSSFEASRLVEICRSMLSAPRYLGKADLAADVQLRQFVREFCRWQGGSSSLANYWDRNRSFDIALRELSARCQGKPLIVETGTIRSEEDWSGAGFSTYLFGSYLYRRGGRLHSVDLNPFNVSFARNWTGVFGDTVTVHERDSLAFLSEFNEGKIDLLYLDSLDATEARHAEHAFRELELSLPKLHDKSLVIFDDTPWNGGKFTGKGAIAVPWLIEQGWKVLYAGYQVVMASNRDGS